MPLRDPSRSPTPKTSPASTWAACPTTSARQPGATAYRFIAADYSATLDIAVVHPRITLFQRWALGVGTDALTLKGQLSYHVERSGLFQVTMDLPQAWEIVSVGPDAVVEDHQLAGTGDHRELTILLKKETLGDFTVELALRPQSAPDAPVDFALPLPAAQDLQLYTGQLWLMLPDHLKAEVDKLDQLAAMPTGGGACWTAIDQMRPAMAFEFKAVDRAKPAGAKFKITVKPTQISATVSRLVNIEQGSLQQEAVVQYQILYAPVDTLYVQVPAALADTAEISGENIKEKVRLTELPADQRPQATSSPATAPSGPSGADAPVYYKIVLQSPVIGPYTLRVNSRQPFTPARTGQSVTVAVEPILAAGKISDQNGQIAIAKADTLAILTPTSKNLTPADPGSAADLPYEPHRRLASLAFKYDAPPFELTLPVQSQAEAAVITTIASAAIVEQVLARDGTLNTHVTYLLTTSRGDRVTLDAARERQAFLGPAQRRRGAAGSLRLPQRADRPPASLRRADLQGGARGLLRPGQRLVAAPARGHAQ